ncbi:hypothetical protein [Jeongeupia sp. USM3]|uniref:DUF6933 domain-containing protein n=1 Tax=Jeongeupia sp. USM3 TaxID=1906741 RepID=UPI00089DF20A|nr:hypothetical protein [Jeongeupia sp. USM3]AOY00141.1 hypothetical protein BJP62_06545 [Jeongeupia sp. USM3]
MLLFQCSGAACEALTSTRKGQVASWIGAEPVDPASAWVWQLHAVKIDRKLVYVAMQRDTRFAMAFWGLKKGDGEALLRLFVERLVNHLLWLNQGIGWLDEVAADAAIERLLLQHRDFRFAAGGDRSVQTHINDVVHACRDAVWEVGYLPDNQEEAAGIDGQQNRMLRSVRGGDYFVPDEELLCHWLQSCAGADAVQIEAVRERISSQHRTRRAIQIADAIDATNLPPGLFAGPLGKELLALLKTKR